MEDEFKLKIGREFESLDEAWNFWNEYGSKIGFGVRKYNGTKSKKDGSIITYKYVCCKEGIRKKDRRETTTSRYQPEIRTNCKTRMVVSRIDEKFKITKFNEEHNHPLHTQETVHLLPSQRNLLEVQTHEVDLAEEYGLEPKEAFDLMSTYVGGQENLGYTMIDAKNYLMKKRRKHIKFGEVGCLLEYFQKRIAKNPSFYHKYQLDMEQQVTNVFWADARMLKDYAHFGEVVSLDTTYNTNRDHRPLALFSGFNHHRSAVIFGAALLYDETIESFEWLLETFLDAHTQNKPQTVFTDQDQAMARALSEMSPCMSRDFSVRELNSFIIYNCRSSYAKMKFIEVCCQFDVKWGGYGEQREEGEGFNLAITDNKKAQSIQAFMRSGDQQVRREESHGSILEGGNHAHQTSLSFSSLFSLNPLPK
ncbi:protein FAR1-RELATED SEQUENCE 5-like [Neltuma alba]|uniref:protein FAR1-RELATED SEQUENCE 5-like n=1 Tax=Neltuma alba TaxID=207710 RepID=UPI0010A3740A|nr:protein FAR1-RELATED SEQUENCE 5-like [Prosopis alba]